MQPDLFQMSVSRSHRNLTRSMTKRIISTHPTWRDY